MTQLDWSLISGLADLATILALVTIIILVVQLRADRRATLSAAYGTILGHDTSWHPLMVQYPAAARAIYPDLHQTKDLDTQVYWIALYILTSMENACIQHFRLKAMPDTEWHHWKKYSMGDLRDSEVLRATLKNELEVFEYLPGLLDELNRQNQSTPTPVTAK